ncbi:Zinc/iron permease [Mycotypha africana]|uniref:Zinc/iron permease n=1 Tax=Mycotypha africana TaxID=64632 RepID=UPI0023003B8E|nr:Zinc/iron permease [Mycotypha africana]KAI8966931.1 Zinc/iron permease [Mycotypha africana]
MKQQYILGIFCFLLLLYQVKAQHVHGAADEDHDCAAMSVEDYHLGLRIGAIFILFGTTTIGTFFPIILHRISPYKQGDIREWILTVGKFFGTGVILATAFVHMLPEAMENFHSPCLTDGWLSYGAFGGVFCMIASFALQLLEIVSVTHVNKLQKRSQERQIRDAELGFQKQMTADAALVSEKLKDDQHTATQSPAHQQTTAAEKPTVIKDNSITTTAEARDLEHDRDQHHHHHSHHHIGDDHGHTHGIIFQSEDAYKHIGTYILELGIIMHSIIIGITLSNVRNEQFTTLLIALVFHQFFEGIALGTRLNEIPYKKLYKPVALGFLYTLMTPIGTAIGIGIHASFNPNSYSAVLAAAILDSLSAGILLYNAYVSLMSMEMSHNTAFHHASTFRKICSFLSMYIGAALMSVLGKWA